MQKFLKVQKYGEEKIASRNKFFFVVFLLFFFVVFFKEKLFSHAII